MTIVSRSPNSPSKSLRKTGESGRKGIRRLRVRRNKVSKKRNQKVRPKEEVKEPRRSRRLMNRRKRRIRLTRRRRSSSLKKLLEGPDVLLLVEMSLRFNRNQQKRFLKRKIRVKGKSQKIRTLRKSSRLAYRTNEPAKCHQINRCHKMARYL